MITSAAFAGRVRTAAIAGLRHRAESVEGGEVLEIDGLMLSLTNLADPALNSVGVARPPTDPERALAEAEAAFHRRGMPWFGIELEVGANPEVEDAVRGAGLVLLFSRPTMAVTIVEMPEVRAPEKVEVEAVRDAAGLVAMRSVEIEAFETAPEVAAGLIGPRLLARPDARLFAARRGRDAVGQSLGLLLAGTVGVFGVGVVERARGHGIGAALTSVAGRAFPDDADLAWLQPSDLAIPLYERLGFRTVSTREVWIRPPA